MTPKITHVETSPGHRLRVGFENGETRLFDVTPYLGTGVFQELRDETYFRRVRAIGIGVEWPNEQDLSADTLYRAGVPATPSHSATASSRDDRTRSMSAARPSPRA